jgi:hypothetical protein
MKVAFIGLGHMCAPMSRNVLRLPAESCLPAPLDLSVPIDPTAPQE